MVLNKKPEFSQLLRYHLILSEIFDSDTKLVFQINQFIVSYYFKYIIKLCKSKLNKFKLSEIKNYLAFVYSFNLAKIDRLLIDYLLVDRVKELIEEGHGSAENGFLNYFKDCMLDIFLFHFHLKLVINQGNLFKPICKNIANYSVFLNYYLFWTLFYVELPFAL